MNMIQIIKKAAIDAMAESVPTAILYGDVISAEPLEIRVDERLILPAEVLLLSSDVIDKEVEVTVDDLVETGFGPEAHNHPYKGRKRHLHHKGLKPGEKVLLLRVQGGQKYVVLDRLVQAI